MFFDYHVHSNFSRDGSASVEEVAAEAIKRNLSGICFTDHIEANRFGDISFKYEEYMDSVEKIKNKYSSNIQISTGTELGLQLGIISDMNNFLRCKQFDFIIGSVHRVNKKRLFNKEFYYGKSKNEAYTDYLNYVLELIKRFDNFDVFGHLDIVRRYNDYKDNRMPYNDYADMIDQILRELIYRGKGIEINTSGKRYNLDFHHPSMEILKAYRRIGGEIITTGSDAHLTEHIAYDFDNAYDVLKQCGFNYVSIFKERKLTQIKI